MPSRDALETIRIRRAALGVRIAADRLALAVALDALRKPIGFLDRAYAAVRYLRAHRALAGMIGLGGLGVGLALRRRRWVRLGLPMALALARRFLF